MSRKKLIHFCVSFFIFVIQILTTKIENRNEGHCKDVLQKSVFDMHNYMLMGIPPLMRTVMVLKYYSLFISETINRHTFGMLFFTQKIEFTAEIRKKGRVQLNM